MSTRALRLRLFVAGSAPQSEAALASLREILASRDDVTATLEIVDVIEEPERVLKERILVTPTLIRLGPKPQARVVGNLSDKRAMLSLLGVSQE